MDTTSYQDAVTEFRRLTGADTPAGERCRRAREASRSGACAGCERPLEDGEPVWMCVFSFSGPVGHSWTAAAVCARCYKGDTPEQIGALAFRRYWLAGWHAQWAFTADHRCKGCGRTVRAHSASVARYCTAACRADAHKRRRRVEHEPVRCECGKIFTPTRADAIYCSNACRQRAYRQRAQG